MMVWTLRLEADLLLALLCTDKEVYKDVRYLRDMALCYPEGISFYNIGNKLLLFVEFFIIFARYVCNT